MNDWDDDDEEGEDSDESFFVDDISKADRDILDEYFVTPPVASTSTSAAAVEDPFSLALGPRVGRMLSLFHLEEAVEEKQTIPIGVEEEEEDQFDLEDGHGREEREEEGDGGGGEKNWARERDEHPEEEGRGLLRGRIETCLE